MYLSGCDSAHRISNDCVDSRYFIRRSKLLLMRVFFFVVGNCYPKNCAAYTHTHTHPPTPLCTRKRDACLFVYTRATEFTPFYPLFIHRWRGLNHPYMEMGRRKFETRDIAQTLDRITRADNGSFAPYIQEKFSRVLLDVQPWDGYWTRLTLSSDILHDFIPYCRRVTQVGTWSFEQKVAPTLDIPVIIRSVWQ